MRVAALLHRVSTADPKFPLSKKIVQMATIDGARVLGQGERLGSLEIGKQADIIALDLNNAHSSPIYDLYAHLVYSAMSSDVHMTMVAGNYLFKEGEYLSLDAEMILEQSRKYRDKIKKYANREE
jgi:5-methylthioadenosine/S-adenosylhomocysteine deaminase